MDFRQRQDRVRHRPRQRQRQRQKEGEGAGEGERMVRREEPDRMGGRWGWEALLLPPTVINSYLADTLHMHTLHVCVAVCHTLPVCLWSHERVSEEKHSVWAGCERGITEGGGCGGAQPPQKRLTQIILSFGCVFLLCCILF